MTFGNTSSSCQAVHFTFPRMIFYMQPPSRPRKFIVDSSICLDIETAAKCPFEETCEPCPEGCFCVNPFTCWPQPGYYPDQERARRCKSPSYERCQGWDNLEGAVRCGKGYKNAQKGCAECEQGYFLDSTGACSLCFSGVDRLMQALGILLAISSLYLRHSPWCSVLSHQGGTAKGCI